MRVISTLTQPRLPWDGRVGRLSHQEVDVQVMPGAEAFEFPGGDGPDGRTGYCEQFASAMAVLARILGIPARVAVGF